MDATSVPRFIATILLVGGAAIFLWPLVSSGWAKVSGAFKGTASPPKTDPLAIWHATQNTLLVSGMAFRNALEVAGAQMQADAVASVIAALVVLRPQLPAPTTAPTVINVTSAPSVP